MKSKWQISHISSGLTAVTVGYSCAVVIVIDVNNSGNIITKQQHHTEVYTENKCNTNNKSNYNNNNKSKRQQAKHQPKQHQTANHDKTMASEIAIVIILTDSNSNTLTDQQQQQHEQH